LPDSPAARAAAPRARAFALVWLVAVLVGAALGQSAFARAQLVRAVQWEEFLRHRMVGLAWYAALGLAALGLAWSTRGWSPLAIGGRARRGAAVALALLVLVAGWLRFHRLEELPPGLWVDEALNGVQAVEIAASGRPLVALPLEDVRTGLGAGFVDLAGLAFALFDFDDGPWGVRAVAAVIGICGVAAVAALAWIWCGPLTALAATSWLAVSQWHLNYSRWGEMPLLSSVVETLLALAVTIGLRARGRRAWAAWLLAGALAGVGVYTYQTFRLFVVLAVLAGGVAAWRHRAALAGRWGAIGAAAVLALAVATPMLHYAVTATQQFGERAADTLIFGRDDWREQLAESLPRSLLAFQLVGDDNPRHNLPFAPLLTAVPAALAALGLALCLARARQPPHGVVVLWFAAALLPGVITLEAPHASRLLDAIVPLALMIGVAVDALAAALVVALPRRVAVVVGTGLALAAAWTTARAEWQAYFVAREQLPAFTDAFFTYESAPGRYLAERTPDAVVFLDPITYWQPATRFLAHRFLAARPDDVRELRLAHDFPPRQPLPRDALYLLPRPYASFAAVLMALSPRTACETWRDRFERIDLVACRVPRDEINRAVNDGWRPPFGLRGRFYAAADGSGTPLAEAPLPYALAEYALDQAPIGRFGLAQWDGTIDLPRDGEYVFRLNPDTTTLDIDGQRIISHAGADAHGGGHEGRATLRAGRRPIRVTLVPGNGPNFLWLYWQPPDEEGDWVPADALRPPADGLAAPHSPG